MNRIIKVTVPRIVKQGHHTFTSIPRILVPISTKLTPVSYNRMAQKTITSFFKVSPPKPVETQKSTDEEQVEHNGEESAESSVSNGTRKTSIKRSRIESSGSDSSPKKHESSPVGSDKKRKVKRQRIESSGSECDVSSQEDEKVSSLSPDKPTIKVEKSATPKTYASPKTKEKKPLTEQNKLQKSPSPKKVKSEDVKLEKITPSKEPKLKQEKINRDSKSEKKSNQTETKDKKDKTDGGLVPEVEYNPAKDKYDPIKDACWSEGAAVPYLALARTLELIEGTSSRLKMVEILSNYMRSVMALTPEDLLPSVYLCLNQLAPAYESLELGIAETYLMKAIGQCTGRTLAQVKAAAAKSGDLGLVAERARATQRTMCAPPKLALRRVLAALRDVARLSGQSSVNKKINKIQSLYVACRHSEARYLIRSLEGKLRVGLAELSVLSALALAAARHEGGAESPDAIKERAEQYTGLVRAAYCECPNYERLVPVLLQHGARALPAHCRLTPGVPLKPMLAHPTKQVLQVFDRFEKEPFTCEWKYDGERAQIHVPGDESGPHLEKAAIFSRNQENNTEKYPDVLGRLPSLLKDSVNSCVLDCEAVAYDTEKKQILPFQVLATRRRKAAAGEPRVAVCVFVFDLLYLNGRALVAEPLRERRRLLRAHFREQDGEWQWATSADCESADEVSAFMEAAVRGSCEGLMVKALSGERSRYDIARRSHNWLKLKKDYLDGVGDTLDVVVIGAYRGRGKRAGLFGGFLLACYDPASDEYQSLCKIGTGFSDDDLRTLTDALQHHVIDGPRNYYRFEESHAADVWVSAASVWEVRAADLSLSPAHRAAIGLVHAEKGISLRFPRFVRVRDDKTPEQATTAQQIADMYLSQDQVKNTAAASTNLDEYY